MTLSKDIRLSFVSFLGGGAPESPFGSLSDVRQFSQGTVKVHGGMGKVTIKLTIQQNL